MTELTFEIKKALKAHCKSIVVDKIKALEEAMNSAQESANSETRSTAGDKHDTARAMMHLEKENMGNQQAQNLHLLKVMEELNDTTKEIITPGTLIQTNLGNYYLSISLGQIKFEGKPYFVISAQSPIGKQFLGKEKEGSITFNGNTITIKSFV